MYYILGDGMNTSVLRIFVPLPFSLQWKLVVCDGSGMWWQWYVMAVVCTASHSIHDSRISVCLDKRQYLHKLPISVCPTTWRSNILYLEMVVRCFFPLRTPVDMLILLSFPGNHSAKPMRQTPLKWATGQVPPCCHATWHNASVPWLRRNQRV